MTKFVALIAAASLAGTVSASAEDAATSQLTPTIGTKIENTIVEPVIIDPATGASSSAGMSGTATALSIAGAAIVIGLAAGAFGDDDDGDGNGTNGSPGTN